MGRLSEVALSGGPFLAHTEESASAMGPSAQIARLRPRQPRSGLHKHISPTTYS